MIYHCFLSLRFPEIPKAPIWTAPSPSCCSVVNPDPPAVITLVLSPTAFSLKSQSSLCLIDLIICWSPPFHSFHSRNTKKG